MKRTNINVLLISMFALVPYQITFSNNITTQMQENLESALSVMIQDNEDRINRVFNLCNNETENIEVFMEKARAFIEEHIQWQQANASLLWEHGLAHAIDIVWINALQELEKSLNNENNPLLQQKKMIAIQMIREGLKGNIYSFLQN